MECLATYISRKKRKGFKCNTVLGCSYALSAALCGAAASLCIKLVQTADAGEILMMRWFVQYIVLLPLVTHRRQVTVGRNRSLNAALAIRVVAGTAASTLLYLNFTLLPVGDATAIMLTYIVMVGLLSLTVLKGKGILSKAKLAQIISAVPLKRIVAALMCVFQLVFAKGCCDLFGPGICTVTRRSSKCSVWRCNWPLQFTHSDNFTFKSQKFQ